jgi:hypothetical protein
MKPEKKFTYCEYCNTAIEITSPPTKKQYKKGIIEIKNGTILLSPKIVKQNHKKGITDSHSKNINGYFCNYRCLIKYIKKILCIKTTNSYSPSDFLGA